MANFVKLKGGERKWLDSSFSAHLNPKGFDISQSIIVSKRKRCACARSEFVRSWGLPIRINLLYQPLGGNSKMLGGYVGAQTDNRISDY